MGLFPGKAPFGYKNYRPSERDLSVFVLDPGPAEYMKTVFDLFSSGLYTEKSLWDELEKRFSHLSKRPNLKRLSVLLRNPFYYGDFYFDQQLHRGNPEYHPRLVSREVWNRVQEVLSGRYRKRVVQRHLPYLGLIRCGGVILADGGHQTFLLLPLQQHDPPLLTAGPGIFASNGKEKSELLGSRDRNAL